MLTSVMTLTQEERAQAARLKEEALAEKAKAEQEAQELEQKREEELQRYHAALNTRTVFGQFLFELFVKALLPASSTAGTQEQHKQLTKEKTKQQPRFL